MTEFGILKRWRLASHEPHLDRYAEQWAVPPLLAALLLKRGIRTCEDVRLFQQPKLTDLHDPALLPNLTRAADRLLEAIRAGQRIVIYGDYDVDGVTASAILWHSLSALGGRVKTYVPHRIDEGYGLNSQAVAQLCRPDEAGLPLLITVDCGITAQGPTRVAREAGVDLIVTDHHEFDPQSLPDAWTIVHPRLGDGVGSDQPRYPFGGLCGAGVAFKLAWELGRRHFGTERLPEDFRGLLLDLLSLAALGTVADVVPLVGENRTLTRFGLSQIKRTRFAGLNALIDASRLREEKIDAFHVGFVLGPRLNACGRMGHAADALALLTETQTDRAAEIAALLCKENERRRATEQAIAKEARKMVEECGYDRDDCRAIVVAKEGWHGGVLGVVASRLVDAYGRPAIVLTYENGVAKGSARSIPGFSIHDALIHCRDHLLQFGGHAMAAGLHLETSRVEAFRQDLIDYANTRLTAQDLVGCVEIDVECRLEDLNLHLFEQIQTLAPFGKDNPSPVLCLRGAPLARPAERVGAGGQHLRLLLGHSQRMLPAIGFHLGELAERLPGGVVLDIVFEPGLSTYLGYPRMDLHILDVKRCDAPTSTRLVGSPNPNA